MDAREVLEQHLPALERSLMAALGSDGTPLTAAARYVLGWEDADGRPSTPGGKRLRPLLTLHVASLFRADPSLAMPGAVAIELIHNFSLVHDEVQDRDAERHGRPTLWARLGEAQAINAGDFLFARAFAALGGVDDPLRAAAALGALSRATERMIRGQWHDLEFERAGAVPLDDYLSMVAGKTGALLGAAAEIGALLAGAPAEAASALANWGVSIGLAFQMQDDYLGIWGDEAVTGKSNRNDLVRRKKTLPVLLGLQDERTAPALQRLFEGGADDAVGAVVEQLGTAGIPDRTREFASRYRERADEIVDRLPLDADAQAELRAIGRLLVERDR